MVIVNAYESKSGVIDKFFGILKRGNISAEEKCAEIKKQRAEFSAEFEEKVLKLKKMRWR